MPKRNQAISPTVALPPLSEALINQERSFIATHLSQAVAAHRDLQVIAPKGSRNRLQVLIRDSRMYTVAVEIGHDGGFWLVEFDDGQILTCFADVSALTAAVVDKLSERFGQLRPFRPKPGS